tara:strand:- start:7 stop:354 length:348 start_codon:yes stop_codon:yes gene_type:complete
MSDQYIKNGKRLYVPQSAFGVCVWKMPDGGIVADADGNYLCAEGMMNDPKVEKHVAEAAKYWTGSTDGQVMWIDGARKVSASERDDQVERLNQGLTPDPLEDTIIALSNKKKGTG